jgi:hypothetical protein
VSSETSKKPWLVRSDFASDALWTDLIEQVLAPQIELGQEFFADVECISDGRFEGLDPVSVVHHLPESYNYLFCMVADRHTFETAELPILIIGFAPSGEISEELRWHPQQVQAKDLTSFRAVPRTIQSIENNLSLANLDFEDFVRSVASDGIFRGFQQ